MKTRGDDISLECSEIGGPRSVATTSAASSTISGSYQLEHIRGPKIEFKCSNELSEL